MEVTIGARASRTKTFSEADVLGFAQVSGDVNPVHLDETYAAGTVFGRRIVHGMLTASVISAALANDLPGEGTIYLNQTLTFKKPVFIGDSITAQLEVTDFNERRRIATIRTTCINQNGDVVLVGEAVVLAPATPVPG